MTGHYIFALLLLSFTRPTAKQEPIPWESNRRLTWSDFKAAPPANKTNAALTSSGILMSFTSDGESFHYELSCNFDPNSSWGRVKNDYILAHEQGHFDIAEWHTRKLNKALKAYSYRANSISKDLNTIYGNTMRELQQMQEQYDGQTDHSRNAEQQKNWLIKIYTALEDLKAYAVYK